MVRAPAGKPRAKRQVARRGPSHTEPLPQGGAERDFGANFERIDGATRVRRRDAVKSVRTTAPLGTLLSARSEVNHGMWRAQAWRGRAGQAFKLGEPGVMDRDHRQFARRELPRAATGWPGRQVEVPREELLASPGPGPPGQREPAHERTGRLKKKPGTMAGLVQGWAGHPFQSRQMQLTSRGTPAPDARAPRLVTHWADRDQARRLCLSSDSCLL
jgi:hypothetical protein